MTLVFISFSLFFVSATFIIGYQYYNDLEALIYDRTDSAARLFKSEFESDMRRTEHALSNFGLNESVIDNLTLLNQYGPLYSEDGAIGNDKIPDSDNSYYLQSQLALVSSLIPLMPQYDLSHLAIYQLAPFPKNQKRTKHLSLIMSHDYVWIFRYLTKGDNPKFEVYKAPLDKIDIEENLFNVSDIYQYKTNYFLNKVGLSKTDNKPHDYLNSLPVNDLYSGKTTNIVADKFSISIWSPILLSLSNPDTWEKEIKNSSIILGVKTPSRESLTMMGENIGGEFAIVEGDYAWVSGISNKISVDTRDTQTDSYVLTTQELSIVNLENRTFHVMSRTSKYDLNKRTISLLIELIIIALSVLSITGLAMYFLINFILNTPLKSLLSGVKSIEQGDFNFKVEVPGKNELAMISTSFNDMTSQIRQSSDDLKLANETLELKVKDRTNELIEAQQQLIMSEKMASLGQLVAGVAHEINTPLGIAITSLSYSKVEVETINKSFKENKITQDNFIEFIDHINESIKLSEINLKKASELVQTFKKVAVNQSVEELVEFSILEQIQEVLKTLEPKLRKHNVEIKLNIDKDIIILNYPGSFYHIVSNLLMNSLIHAFPDDSGKIEITVMEKGEKLELSFLDDGIGMNEETRHKIFDPFYTTKRGSGGTGLGMYVIYNIVTQRLGGSIEVESEENKGTKFSISILKTPPDGGGCVDDTSIYKV
jgi:signal transduction histidine kinase